MQSSKKMYEEVGGIVSGGKAAEQKGSSRISIVEVDDDDEEDESDEENESDGGEHATVENSDDYIPAKKFQGRKPGYVFKKDQSGLGYYLDPVQQPIVNDIETRVAASKSDSPKSVDSDGYVQLESPTNKDNAMTAEDRMKFGMEAKEEGSKFFKSGKLGNAYRSFSRAIDLFPSGHEEEVKCLNNRALVSMRLSNHEDVVNDCTRVLESKSGKDNVKALLRRGAAREELGRFQEALDDMCSVMKLDPSREPVSNAISRLLVKMQNNNGTKSPREKKVDSKAATPAKKQKKPTRGEKQSVNVEKKKMKDEKKILENAKAKAVKEKKKADIAKESENKRAAPQKEKEPAAPQIEVSKPKASSAEEEEQLSKSAEEYKNEGNSYFKEKKFAAAIHSYDKAIRGDRTCVAALANRAMAKLQVKDYVGAVADSTNGLISLRDLKSNHSMRVKLLYRRASANKFMGKLHTALDDFNAILEKEPENKRALKEKEELSKVVAPPQNPETVNRVQRMRAANELAERAAKKITQRKEDLKFEAPKSFLEFEKARKELQSNITQFAEYLLLIKPKSLKKILKSSLTEEILTTTVKALASEFIPDKSSLALSYLKHLSKVPRFDTTAMFLGDDCKQMLRSIFSHLEASGEKPDVVKTVKRAWKL